MLIFANVHQPCRADRPRKRSNLTAKQQRALGLHVKRARFMGFLPLYT